MKRALTGTLVSRLVAPYVYSYQLSRHRRADSLGSRSRFLVLRYRYAHGSPDFGPSNEEDAVSAPLRATDVADFTEFCYDESPCGGVFGDGAFVRAVERSRPSLIVLSSYNDLDEAHPSLSVLETVRRAADIPFLVIWHDSTGARASAAAARLAGLADLNVMIDSGALSERFPGQQRFLRLWAPLENEMFSPFEGSPDVPVSFLGSTGAYRDVRNQYLDFLTDNQVGLYHSGGQKERLIDRQTYADVMRRSRISLNFSHSVAGTHQLKLRVFEITRSGAMLMENENDQTSQFFTPMTDYVSFDSKEDLLDKTRYFLDHEEERREIAYNGHKKAITQYSSQVFWRRIMERMDALGLVR